MKRFLKVLLGILVVLVIFIGIGFYSMTKDIKEGKTVEINNVNIATLSDGEYNGKFSFSRWQSEVNVIVKNGKIMEIKLISPPLVPDISTQLFDEVIKNQRIDVDVVSGATVTSKAHLKAVENALSR